MSIVYNYMLYFFIYSFLGWVCESIYCSCLQKKVINRGFLNGPVCPVYGVGALIIIIGCWSYRDSMIGVFISGMILTSMLEYITATILEKLFHAKWWDYSNHKCNINGKVCLLNSTMFGIMSVFVVEFLHPFIINNLEKMNTTVLYVLLIFAIITMISDLIVTARALGTLTLKVDSLTMLVDDMKKIHSKFSSLKQKAFIHRRLINAFPNMRSSGNKKRDAHFQYIKKMLREKNK